MARTERHLSYVDAELEEAQGEVPERMAPPRARPEGPKGGRGQGRLEESPTARWKREDRELNSGARNHHFLRLCGGVLQHLQAAVLPAATSSHGPTERVRP